VSISRTNKKMIALFIVFAAIALGVYSEKALFRGKRNPTDPQAERIYKDANNSKKVKLTVSVEGFQEKVNQIGSLLSRGNARVIYNRSSGYSSLILFEVSDSIFTAMEKQLGQIGTISDLVSVTSEDVTDVNIQTKMADLQLMKNRYLNDIKSSKVSSSYLYDRVNDIQARIDSLTTVQNSMNYRMNYHLVQLTIMDSVSTKIKPVQVAKNVLIRIVLFIIGLTLLYIALYYGSLLVGYIMSLMGIRSSGRSGKGGYGSYGSYNNRYGSYYNNYGYGRQRKVKRIYKGSLPENEKNPEDK